MEDGTPATQPANDNTTKQSRSIGPTMDNTVIVKEEPKSMDPLVHRALVIWLISVGIASIFLLIKLWPPSSKIRELQNTVDTLSYRMDSISTVANSVLKGTNNSATRTKTVKKTNTSHSDSVLKVIGQLASEKVKVPEKETKGESSIYFLIAIFAGVLGGTLHALSSIMDFRGQGRLYSTWATWYLCLPIEGGMVSIVFLFILKAGLFSTSNFDAASPFGIAAFGMMCGLFTDKATTKLGELVNTLIFTKTVRDDKLTGETNPQVPVSGSSKANAGKGEASPKNK